MHIYYKISYFVFWATIRVLRAKYIEIKAINCKANIYVSKNIAISVYT